MMTSVESMLTQVKRRGERLMEKPGVRRSAEMAGCFGGGVLLSGVSVGGSPQPVTMGLVLRFRGVNAVAAVLGSALGYLLLWGKAGLTGLGWTVSAFLLALLLPEGRGWRFGGCALTAAGIGALTSPEGQTLAIQVGLAGLSGLASCTDGAAGQCLFWGAGTLALTCRSPCLGAGAAGFAAGALPAGWALAMCVGADLGSHWMLLTPAAALHLYLERLLPRGEFTRGVSLAASLVLVMTLSGNARWLLCAAALCGGFLGAVMPRKTPRRGRVGAAQVQLEGMARVLTGLQHQLLEWTAPPPDAQALSQELHRSICESCPNRIGCLEQKRLTAGLLTGEESFQCRKATAAQEVSRCRGLLRRMQSFRAKQEECRMALVQQYGFLSDALRELADRLPMLQRVVSRRRVQVSARSRGKHRADGDRVIAFSAPCGKFYVLLCDGMGTGSEAARQSRETVGLIRQMLQAGLAPGAALGSVNSQLALTGRGGAVTVDLAELNPESGKVWLYKWGAQPSWLLRRHRGSPVGASGPPPGLGVAQGRESVSHVTLQPTDTLVLISDGILPNPNQWSAFAADTPPSALAELILKSATPDDATAVVIRMPPKRRGRES